MLMIEQSIQSTSWYLGTYVKIFSIRTFGGTQAADGFDRAERQTAKNTLADEVKRSTRRINNNIHI